jgi:hypothetical protein
VTKAITTHKIVTKTQTPLGLLVSFETPPGYQPVTRAPEFAPGHDWPALDTLNAGFVVADSLGPVSGRLWIVDGQRHTQKPKRIYEDEIDECEAV